MGPLRRCTSPVEFNLIRIYFLESKFNNFNLYRPKFLYFSFLHRLSIFQGLACVAGFSNLGPSFSNSICPFFLFLTACAALILRIASKFIFVTGGICGYRTPKIHSTAYFAPLPRAHSPACQVPVSNTEI